MKKLTLCIAFILTSVLVFSQTKRIAHRSHSGKDHTFSFLGGDNFGLPGGAVHEMKRRSKKDSLKMVPPVKADSARKDSIRTMRSPITQPVTKKEVFHALLAARQRFKNIGLL